MYLYNSYLTIMVKITHYGRSNYSLWEVKIAHYGRSTLLIMGGQHYSLWEVNITHYGKSTLLMGGQHYSLWEVNITHYGRSTLLVHVTGRSGPLNMLKLPSLSSYFVFLKLIDYITKDAHKIRFTSNSVLPN